MECTNDLNLNTCQEGFVSYLGVSISLFLKVDWNHVMVHKCCTKKQLEFFNRLAPRPDKTLWQKKYPIKKYPKQNILLVMTLPLL